jgi:hypothetical protein
LKFETRENHSDPVILDPWVDSFPATNDPCPAADDGRLDEDGRVGLGVESEPFLKRGFKHTCADASASPNVRRGDVLGVGSGPRHGCTFSFASALLPLLFDEASFSGLISGDVDTAAVSDEGADSRLVSGSDVGLIANLLKEVARWSTSSTSLSESLSLAQKRLPILSSTPWTGFGLVDELTTATSTTL